MRQNRLEGMDGCPWSANRSDLTETSRNAWTITSICLSSAVELFKSQEAQLAALMAFPIEHNLRIPLGSRGRFCILRSDLGYRRLPCFTISAALPLQQHRSRCRKG